MLYNHSLEFSYVCQFCRRVLTIPPRLWTCLGWQAKGFWQMLIVLTRVESLVSLKSQRVSTRHESLELQNVKKMLNYNNIEKFKINKLFRLCLIPVKHSSTYSYFAHNRVHIFKSMVLLKSNIAFSAIFVTFC